MKTLTLSDRDLLIIADSLRESVVNLKKSDELHSFQPQLNSRAYEVRCNLLDLMKMIESKIPGVYRRTIEPWW